MVASRTGLVKALCLQQRANLGDRCARGPVWLAVDQHRPAVWLVQAQDHPHRRGLACAVGAQKAGHDTGVDRETDIVDRSDLSVALGQVPDFNHFAPYRLNAPDDSPL